LKANAVEIIRFTDGPTLHEVWELPDAGWDDWATTADQFLADAIRAIVAEYPGERVEWLEVNYWQDSGRLIVWPSQEGPHGDRGERVCFELSSQYLEAASLAISESVPDSEKDAAWAALGDRVWRRVGVCLTTGTAGRELAVARRSHPLRVAAYDYNPGEGPFRLSQDGVYPAPQGTGEEV
jgi:hypothetical protein